MWLCKVPFSALISIKSKYMKNVECALYPATPNIHLRFSLIRKCTLIFNKWYNCTYIYLIILRNKILNDLLPVNVWLVDPFSVPMYPGWYQMYWVERTCDKRVEDTWGTYMYLYELILVKMYKWGPEEKFFGQWWELELWCRRKEESGL